MAGRNSFRDPITNVLKASGFVASNQPGDIMQAEADNFALEPGKWQWNGTAWIPFTPPPSQGELNRNDVRAKIDALVADGTTPQKIKDFVTALKAVL